VGQEAAAPLEIFWTPWATCAPSPLRIVFWAKQTQSKVAKHLFFFREHLLRQSKSGKDLILFLILETLISGSRTRSKPGEALFLERTLISGTKKRSKSGKNLFFFYRERLFLGQNRGPNSIKIPSICLSRFCLSCPKIISAPLNSFKIPNILFV